MGPVSRLCAGTRPYFMRAFRVQVLLRKLRFSPVKCGFRAPSRLNGRFPSLRYGRFSLSALRKGRSLSLRYGRLSPSALRKGRSPSLRYGRFSPSALRKGRSPSLRYGRLSPSALRKERSPSLRYGRFSPSALRKGRSPSLRYGRFAAGFGRFSVRFSGSAGFSVSVSALFFCFLMPLRD